MVKPSSLAMPESSLTHIPDVELFRDPLHRLVEQAQEQAGYVHRIAIVKKEGQV
jgi:hypothetical protein